MTEKATHWMTDDSTRRKFWAYAKGDLGLTEDEVHEALSVESTKDFDGDKDMARAMLKSYAKIRAVDIAARRLTEFLVPQDLPQAPGARERSTAFCDMFSSDGTRIAVTAREGATPDTVALTALALWDGAQILARLGWQTAAENGRPAVAKLAQEPVTRSTHVDTSTTIAEPEQGGNSGVKAGVAALKAIAVDHEDKVLFYVDGFRWPFKDSRGPGAALRYIDADLGFTAENLVPGSKFEGGPPVAGEDEDAKKIKAMMANLVVEWEKPDRYYNVTRVRRLNK